MTILFWLWQKKYEIFKYPEKETSINIGLSEFTKYAALVTFALFDIIILATLYGVFVTIF